MTTSLADDDGDDRYEGDEPAGDNEERIIHALRRAPRHVWQAQLAALTERLLIEPAAQHADAAEVIRALAWAVTSGNATMLGRLRSVAVGELCNEQERRADVPPEERHLPMEHPDLGTVLVEPAPVHPAHAATDEWRMIIHELVHHQYEGLRRQRDPDQLAVLVLGKLVTNRVPRLRDLVPLEGLLAHRTRVANAIRDVLERTDPQEDDRRTARRVLTAALVALDADPQAVKDAYQNAEKSERRRGQNRGGQKT